MLEPGPNNPQPTEGNHSPLSPSLDKSVTISRQQEEFQGALLRAYREKGLEPDIEWDGNKVTVHTFADSEGSAFRPTAGDIGGQQASSFEIDVRVYTPEAIRDETARQGRKGLSQGSQTIRQLRKELSDVYGRHRNWRVSEDYSSQSLVLFYSGSELQASELSKVREIIAQTTELPVRIERRVNQTLLARRIKESCPEGISCDNPAVYDEKFAVVSVPRYEPGSPEAIKVRNWQLDLKEIGRQFGVGVVLRASWVGHAFFRMLKKQADSEGGVLDTPALVRKVREHFFPDAPVERVARSRELQPVDLPMFSIDPLGSDNLPVPGNTLLSEADPEDLIWVGRRPDGGYRFVAAICKVTDSMKLTEEMLSHMARFGQSFYSPLGSYPLLGNELAFRDACFQEGKPGAAFFIDKQFSWDGTPESYSVYDGLATSVTQLSFNRADRILASKEVDKNAELLNVARDFAFARRINRVAQSEVWLESRARQNRYDSVSGIMIEESMLATKAAVGQFFHDNGITATNRVYGPPTLAQRESLQRKLARLNIEVSVEDLLNERIVSVAMSDLNHLRQRGSEQERHESGQLLNEFFACHQFGASYSAESSGHGDLNMPYLSPIKGREGPGVVNQFILDAAIHHEEVSDLLSEDKVKALARAFSRSDNFYSSRSHGLVFLQALENGLEKATEREFHAVWDVDRDEWIVPLFENQIQQVFEDYESIAKDLSVMVLAVQNPPANRGVYKVRFKEYNLDERRFEFILEQ